MFGNQALRQIDLFLRQVGVGMAPLRRFISHRARSFKSALMLLLVLSNLLAGFPAELILELAEASLHQPAFINLVRRITNNQQLADSLADYKFRPVIGQAQALVSSYDYNACSTTCDTDSTWNAFADDVDQFPFGGTAANRNTHTEMVDADYANIASSNDGRYSAANPSTSDETFMWFEMPISEPAAAVHHIDFTFEGYPVTTTATFSIWVKTAAGAYETDSSWTQVGTTQSITADTETSFTRSLTVNPSNYVDGSGNVVWGVFESTSALVINTDYVKMDVTHYPVEQEGFRFRNDNGSETTATWLAAQDTNTYQPISTNTRLRMLLNATNTGNPDNSQYQLNYKKSTDSVYSKVEPPSDLTTAPTVQSRSSAASTAVNATSHAITMPSGITAGDLLLLVFSTDGRADVSITTGNWVKLDELRDAADVSQAIFYKFAEGGDTATVTTGSEQTSHVVLRISGAGAPISAAASGSSTNSDPPNLDTGRTKNYLWVATRSGDSTVTATVAPSGYSNLQTIAAAGTGGASTNTAELTNSASSENPGTFTSNTEQWVSATIAVPPASIGLKSIGAAAIGTTSLSVPYPANISVGDLLVLPIANKHSATPTTPTGWTAPSNNQASGTSGTDALDTGTVYTTVYTRIADGTETGNLSVTITSGNAAVGRIMVMKRESGKVWSVAATNGNNNTPSTSWSVTGAADPGIAADDVVLAVTGINSDAFSYTLQGVTATGATFVTAAENEAFESGTTSGNDLELIVSHHYVVSGTASSAPVYAMTVSTSAANSPAGATVFLRARQTTAPIQISTSSNITASGEATTALLTAPSGKTTGDFLAGRMQDDENPADAVDLSATQYTEMEWSLTATSVAVDAEIYQFRVYVGTAPLRTYTVTPEWTIGSPGTQDVSQIRYRWRNDDGGETASGWYDANWGYRKQFTIDNTDVAGSADLTNFPVLISVTSTDFKDVGNSGHVGQSDGGDILFTNSAGTKLDHEITKYVPSTGQLIAWVEVDTLDYDNDTVLYMYYGYAAASDQWNIAGTWSNNYLMVQHFNETTGTHFDATSNNNDTTVVAVTTQGTATSKIDGADDFNGTSDYLNIGDSATLDLTNYTLSGWFSVDSFPGVGQYTDLFDKSAYYFELTGTDELNCGVFDSSYSDHTTTTANLATGTYYHLACAIDDTGNTAQIYVNGSPMFSPAETESKTPSTNGNPLGMFRLSNITGQWVDGRADEAVISSTPRSADWLATEYNNQNNPAVGGFLTSISSEETQSSGATWAAAEDTSLSSVPVSTTYRLRLELSNEGAVSTSSTTYQIQVAETGTCSSGTYSAIPTDSSGDWQIVASTHFTDGAATSNVASGLTDENTSFVAGQIKDTGNTTSGITLTSTEFTELEFALTPTSNATGGGNYCFRLNNVDTYTIYAQATVAGSLSYTLSAYRWYVDSDSQNVTDVWGTTDLAESTALALVPATNTPPVDADEIRLRVAITAVGGTLSATSQQFKLQYKAGTDASCTSGSWTDVGASGGIEVWRFATSSVTDGTTLTLTKLTPSDILQAYAKSNPTATNPNSVTSGQDMEYDFHMQMNGAAPASMYSFRVVKSDGSALGQYTTCPTLTTLQSTDQQLRHGTVFSDESEQGFTRAD